MNQKILVINGPNLNLLGTREKEKYGKSSLEDIKNKCESYSKKIGLEVEFRQSNVEGEIVNFIQDSSKNYEGIIINAGGMSTVPEVILAHHQELPLCALSVITNYAAGMSETELSHEQTIAFASKASDTVEHLLVSYLNSQ